MSPPISANSSDDPVMKYSFTVYCNLPRIDQPSRRPMSPPISANSSDAPVMKYSLEQFLVNVVLLKFIFYKTLFGSVLGIMTKYLNYRQISL